tara:strand:+ start:2520 stop:2783 length:264 start_codon:yes stop_codon:yes gene_type:complete
MEERIKLLESEIEKLRDKLNLLEKNHEISLKNTIESIKVFTDFMLDNNKLTKKIEHNFITLEKNDEKTYKKVNEIITMINDMKSDRI